MDDSTGKVAKAQKKYESQVKKMAAGMPTARKEVVLDSGIPVKWLYTPEDVKGMDYLRDLGFPGEYPFTRGPYPTMHRGRYWTMRALAGMGSPALQNQRLKYLIKQGETGLNIIPDYPTQHALDPDDPRAKGEVGRCGANFCSVQDFEDMFDGIDFSKVSTSFVAHTISPVVATMYYVLAEKRGYNPALLEGSIQNDAISNFVRQQYLVLPLKAAFKLSLDTIEFCNKYMPRFNTMTFNEHGKRDCGLTALQGISWALARARAYVQGMIERGWKVDDFVPRFAFFFGIDSNFFEEIAKYRAARRIWARIVKEEFGAKDPASWRMRFAAQSTGRTFAAQEPLNNIARGAIQALAAVLGGCQSLNIDCMDEALGIPTEEAVRTALRTQQIVAYETGVTDTIDPLGGSYYVESLTNAFEEKCLESIREIDRQGGAVAAADSGYFARESWTSAVKYYDEIEQEKRVFVGVNKFRTEEMTKYKILKVDKKYEEDCLEKLARLKQTRDNDKVNRALDKLKESATKGVNLVPDILELVRADGTLGETFGALKEVYGEVKPYRVATGIRG